MSISELINLVSPEPSPDEPHSQVAYEAILNTSPSTYADDVYVVIPSIDPTLQHGPVRGWATERAYNPLKGDSCLVVFDEKMDCWLVSWRPADFTGVSEAGGGGGGAFAQVVNVNSTTTLTVNDEIALVHGSQDVYLPDVHTSGQQHVIKDANGTARALPITVHGSGGDTIDGAATSVLDTNWQSLTYVSNGTNWFRI